MAWSIKSIYLLEYKYLSDKFTKIDLSTYWNTSTPQIWIKQIAAEVYVSYI